MDTSKLVAPLGRVNIKDNYVVRNVTGGLRLMLQDKSTLAYFLFLMFVIVLGVIGPAIAPYEYDKSLRDADGDLKRTVSPSLEHPLGTTDRGYDVFSRVLVGARPTVITGLLGGILIVTIGLGVGVTAGYVGGWVEMVLMRVTDMVYGVPLLPFAIVMITLLGVGFLESIIVIGLILWRGNARVIRSQVLQIKEREFVKAAKASGASTPRIILRHILPNVASMAILFFAIGIGYSIIIQAGLSFLGVTSPFTPSWGVMLRNAYGSGVMTSAWGWAIAPGLLISMTVVSTFMFGRQYEALSGGKGDEALAQMG